MKYRIVTRNVSDGFLKTKTILVLQKFAKVKVMSGYWVDTVEKWVDCTAEDHQQAVLELFCGESYE